MSDGAFLKHIYSVDSSGRQRSMGVQRLKRTSNPYGNYENVYYNPEKAHEYYERTKKLKGYENRYGGSRGGTSTAKTGSSVSRNSSGSGRSSNSGGSGGKSNKSSIAEQVRKLRENSRFETKAQREAAKMQIKDLRDKIKSEVKKRSDARKTLVKDVSSKRKTITNAGKRERERLREKAKKDIERERKASSKKIEKDKKILESKRDSTVDPIRLKNAQLRARIDSLGKNSPERIKLQRELAKNNEKISDAMAQYTDSLSNVSTKHKLIMRESIESIRSNLKAAIEQSSTKQKDDLEALNVTSKAQRESISSEIKKLRKDNSDEIKRIRNELKSWTETEKSKLESTISSITGKENKYNAKNDYEDRVKKRAQEIYNQKTRR